MKNIHWIVAALLIATLGPIGCGKSAKLQESQQVEGESIDLPKLQAAFATSTNAQLAGLVTEAAAGLRYADYMKTMAALEQIAGSPDATEAQKKLTTNVIEQVKKLAAKAPAPAASQ